MYIFSTASPVPLQIMSQSSRWTPIQALDVSSTITIILGNWPKVGCDYCRRPLPRKWKFGCVIWYHYLGEKGECFVRKWGQWLTESRLRKLTCLKKKTRSSTELVGRWISSSCYSWWHGPGIFGSSGRRHSTHSKWTPCFWHLQRRAGISPL